MVDRVAECDRLLSEIRILIKNADPVEQTKWMVKLSQLVENVVLVPVEKGK